MIEIDLDDPMREDVRLLLAVHREDAFRNSPVDAVHALDASGLMDPSISFFSARDGGVLCGIGALRELNGQEGEVKSMHIAEPRRGSGIGSAMVSHLLSVARRRGYQSVLLETGAMEAYAAARSLYRRFGFVDCEPFGEYILSAESVCMRLDFDTGTQ